MNNYEKSLIGLIVLASIYFKIALPLTVCIICLTSYSLINKFLDNKSKSSHDENKFNELSSVVSELEAKVAQLNSKETMKDIIGGFKR